MKTIIFILALVGFCLAADSTNTLSPSDIIQDTPRKGDSTLTQEQRLHKRFDSLAMALHATKDSMAAQNKIIKAAREALAIVKPKNKMPQYILGGLAIASGITIGTLDLIEASQSGYSYINGKKTGWGWDNPDPWNGTPNYRNTIYICISLTAILAGVAEIIR